MFEDPEPFGWDLRPTEEARNIWERWKGSHGVSCTTSFHSDIWIDANQLQFTESAGR